MEFEVLNPRGNEVELAACAVRIGWREIVFLYTDLKAETPKLDVKARVKKAFLATKSDEVAFAKSRFDVVVGVAERAFFENKKTDCILLTANSPSSDFLFQRRADLDDACCALAKKNNITLLFDVGNITDFTVLGRMAQNARLARKHSLNIQLVTLSDNEYSLRAPRDLNALLRVITSH